MSSMFKKKAGPSFKPKIRPRARPGPGPSTPGAPTIQSIPPAVVSDASITTKPPFQPSPSDPVKPSVASPETNNEQELTEPVVSHDPAAETLNGPDLPSLPSSTPSHVTPPPASTSSRLETSLTASAPGETHLASSNITAAVEISSEGQQDVTPPPVKSLQESSSTHAAPHPGPHDHTSAPSIEPPGAIAPEVIQTPLVSHESVDNSVHDPALRDPAAVVIDPSLPTSTPVIPQTKPSQPQETLQTGAPTAPKRGRKRNAPKDPSVDPDQTEEVSGTSSTKPRPRRKKEATGEAEGEQPKPKRVRRKQSTEDGSENRSGSEKPARQRRARSETPPDAELQIVDLQKLRMADLTRDLRIGKKFSRHDELRDREKQTRIKQQLGRARSDSASPSPGSLPEIRTKISKSPEAMAPPPTAGPQFQIVDGQIVVNQSSLVMDRHARDAGDDDMEVVEENDFTRLITSNSYLSGSKLRGPNHWTLEDTEQFYKALRMIGTDFEIISKMFPGRNRRHVKMKFNREERVAPARITAALMGERRIKLDFNEYQKHTGMEYESIESIEAQQKALEDEHEAEQKRIEDEQAEINRKKNAELWADDPDEAPKEVTKTSVEVTA